MSKTIWKLMLHLLLYTHVQSCSETNQVCCRLWLKNCCKNRDFFLPFLTKSVHIVHFTGQEGMSLNPGQTTNHSHYTDWWDYASCNKKSFLSSDDSSFGGDMMVVANCLERVHVGLSVHFTGQEAMSSNPGQTTNHSHYTDWWDYASCNKKSFLSSDDSSFGGDMMVVAYCLERVHVGLSGWCRYWCGWAKWHKTCIQEAV